MIKLALLDDLRAPTTDFVFGRVVVRVNVWINGDHVLADGVGVVDTGARHCSIALNSTGQNVPDELVPSIHAGGSGTTGIFRLSEIQIDKFRRLPVTFTQMPVNGFFDVLIGRDALRFCSLVIDHPNSTYTLDVP